MIFKFVPFVTNSAMYQIISPSLLIFLIFTQIVPDALGSNIVFFTNALSSQSHRMGLEPLVIKLADRGHNITFFTPIKSKVPSPPHPNTEFCIQEIVEGNRQFLKKVGARSLKNWVNTKYTSRMDSDTWLFDLSFEMAKCTVKSGEVDDLFQKSSFDMIILDKSSMGDAILGFAYKFNITKIIYYVGMGSLLPWDSDLYGIPNEVSWVPSWQSNYQTKQLSFFDRLQGEISILTWYFGYSLFFLQKIDKLIRDELQLNGMPPLQDLIESVSLILVNGHYSDTFARSLPPFIVQVGGMHLHESGGILPHDIETFISSKASDKQADDEFIFISLGSLFDSSTLPPKLVRIFFDALKSLAPLKFMWKWDGKFPENIPANVILRKWFPQHDVLAHPKCRGFVTQGGQVSMQQGIFNAVPLIIFPVDGDQDYNAKRIRSAGNGIKMEFFDLTAKTLKDAINKLMTDPSYTQAASKLSKASKQRPMHPVDLAVWWTEFVLSQHDVSYLRPQTKNVSWFVTRSLDVWAFIFGAIIFLVTVSLLCFYYSVKIVLRICLNNGAQTEFTKRE